MPPRLAHKKSRKGCMRCKLRKVKCDETRPTCSACLKHGITCSYPNAFSNDAAKGPETSKRERSLSVEGLDAPYVHTIFDPISADRQRIQELFLLHHYTTETVKTFPGYGVPGAGAIFVVEQIHLGFEHPFLLNAVFALAALHLVLVPSTRPFAKQFDFARLHRLYLNLAVQEQRVALQSINEGNAHALCLGCIMMNMIATKILPDSVENEPYAPPIKWLNMSTSIGAISKATRPYIRGMDIIHIMVDTSGPDFWDPDVMYDYNYTGVLRSIRDFEDVDEVFDAETDAMYDKVLAYVSAIRRAILTPDLVYQICRRLMAFGPMTPRLFTTLVSERRPRALVILAHHMAMTKYTEQFWWFQGIAERDVYGIQKLIPDKWQWAMEGPLTILATPVQLGAIPS